MLLNSFTKKLIVVDNDRILLHPLLRRRGNQDEQNIQDFWGQGLQSRFFSWPSWSSKWSSWALWSEWSQLSKTEVLLCDDFHHHSWFFMVEKWQVALVKLDPWRELIWRQVERRSASWYSCKYCLVFGGTGSVEGTTCWCLKELGQY